MVYRYENLINHFLPVGDTIDSLLDARQLGYHNGRNGRPFHTKSVPVIHFLRYFLKCDWITLGRLISEENVMLDAISLKNNTYYINTDLF